MSYHIVVTVLILIVVVLIVVVDIIISITPDLRVLSLALCMALTSWEHLLPFPDFSAASSLGPLLSVLTGKHEAGTAAYPCDSLLLSRQLHKEPRMH